MDRSPWLVMALFLVGTLLLAWFGLRALESFPPLPRLLGSLSLPFVCILSICVPAYWIFAGHERIRESYRYITEPIEEQLNARPIVCSWRGDSVEDGVLVALSDAVGLEKCVPHSPALHPKDSLRYLLWGAFDDITPLVFRTNFDKRFKCDPVAAVLEGVDKNWNLDEFVAACIQLIPPQQRGTQALPSSSSDHTA